MVPHISVICSIFAETKYYLITIVNISVPPLSPLPQEIDGKALLLLNSDMMMKYMGLKLGPALKICNLISKVRGKKHVM